ncbi:dual oxidase maturation factor 1 [Lingula anatina]|uniref:Dual oxidase maturation factor 1 n=1 Tax=Lingula anatina TaxID=7574 RepID=A0A1S3JPV8_LINAN|nr:dual oxidase maturation factor 1 [Lingula anatina]|eukprot:XP_013412171.1 dual oxidase maturation factor 1 [Lingula anatina]
MTTFTGFRNAPGPSLYPSTPSAVTEDVTLGAVITLVVIVAIAYLCVLVGIPASERLNSLLRYLVAATISASILVSLYGHGWYTAGINTSAEYKPTSADKVSVSIGMHVGLKEVNVTMKGIPEEQLNETINYNEVFKMTGVSSLKKDFKQGLRVGLPLPVLYIAEYLATDAGNARWGRNFRMAGHYCYIFMWAAFAVWMLSCVLYFMSVRRGAQATLITAGCLLMANVVYAAVTWNQLAIPFSNGKMPVVLGWCYWLALATGVTCFIFGVAVLIVERISPDKNATFFAIQAPDQEEEEEEVEKEQGENDENIECVKL